MKSIKQGRGNAFISGIVSIFVALFGLFWTVMASQGGLGPFSIFGLLFSVIGIINAIKSFTNAFGKNRHSEFDIVDQTEEPDPWNEHFGTPTYEDGNKYYSVGNSFCPYCGNAVKKDFEFCNNCGKRLPD